MRVPNSFIPVWLTSEDSSACLSPYHVEPRDKPPGSGTRHDRFVKYRLHPSPPPPALQCCVRWLIIGACSQEGDSGLCERPKGTRCRTDVRCRQIVLRLALCAEKDVKEVMGDELRGGERCGNGNIPTAPACYEDSTLSTGLERGGQSRGYHAPPLITLATSTSLAQALNSLAKITSCNLPATTLTSVSSPFSTYPGTNELVVMRAPV